MDRINSFALDHNQLESSIFVSRNDRDATTGTNVVTYDIRMRMPNREPVMGTGAIHAIEHIGATLLRNDPRIKDHTIYFGPMGCRTGFYLVMFDRLSFKEVCDIVMDTMSAIVDWDGDIPGASAIECGNFLDMHLPEAKIYCCEFIRRLS